jgi:hypothetical protein
MNEVRQEETKSFIGDEPWNRYHLLEPCLTLYLEDGPKTFGEGWLLMSEAEYAALTGRQTINA